MLVARMATLLTAGMLLTGLAFQPDPIDLKYPLDLQLKVLAADVKNPHYRQLVLEKMLATDLAAEWQRATTADNAESFLQKHGGKDKVFADPDLKQAYERRLQIRNDFLDLMREGYKRFKLMPPFDKGAKAEAASPTVKQPVLAAMALRCIPLSPEAARQWPSFRGPTGQGHAPRNGFSPGMDQGWTQYRLARRRPGQGQLVADRLG